MTKSGAAALKRSNELAIAWVNVQIAALEHGRPIVRGYDRRYDRPMSRDEAASEARAAEQLAMQYLQTLQRAA